MKTKNSIKSKVHNVRGSSTSRAWRAKTRPKTGWLRMANRAMETPKAQWRRLRPRPTRMQRAKRVLQRPANKVRAWFQ
jgi:hypothetical protein